jgi:hypothetical protein
VGMDRRIWIYAFGWFLLIQILSRTLTSADLNVNLAHRIQPGFEQVFRSFWQFWITGTFVTALMLWILGLVLTRIWPSRMSMSGKS